MTNKRTWVLVLLTVALMLSFATIGMAQKKDKGKPKPPPELELPPVRYDIDLVPLPDEGATGSSINDINNSGVVVGKYNTPTRSAAFIYFPGTAEAIDLKDLVLPANIPEGAWLRSGLAINDWGVVVGSMELDTGETVGFALDLGRTEDPVVDLLPHFKPDDDGSESSYGRQINEDGDILGRFRVSDRNEDNYLFNPGLYGADPNANAVNRELLGGGAQDFRTADTEPLHPLVADAQSAPFLNNSFESPFESRPAQIVGTTVDGVAYRYTLGDVDVDPELDPELAPELELFLEINLGAYGITGGLNDSGTFCGYSVREKKVKGNYVRDPFRYNQSIDVLIGLGNEYPHEVPQDINSSGDVMLIEHVYRDDWAEWGGFVNINDIVTGEDDELEFWSSGGPIWLREMNDRLDVNRDGDFVDASQLVVTLSNSTNTAVLVFLNPIPEPEPEP